MLEIFHSLSDDQVALLGCVAALSVTGLTMFFSYYVGQANRKTSAARIAVGESTVPMQPSRQRDKAA